MLSVNEWIELLEQDRKYRIYVWCRLDVAYALNVSLKHRIHGNPLCDYIKTSPEGLKMCMRCRSCADYKAMRHGTYSAHCIHGLFEAVSPVFINGEWAATVYVSNVCIDREESEKRINAACGRYSLSCGKAVSLLDDTERNLQPRQLEKIAEAAAEIISEKLRDVDLPQTAAMPEIVKKLAEYAQNLFSAQTLKSVARKYGFNEKYLGRIFKRYTGLSFSEYRNKARLKEAAYLLKNSSLKIIDISLSAGYESVSYFNRKFFSEYGVTPSEYREKSRHISR